MKPEKRISTLNIDPEEFRKLGHQLVDLITEYYHELSNMKVTTGESPIEIEKLLTQGKLPEEGKDPAGILEESFELIKSHSLHIGHPKFWGYICGSGAPISALADFLASAINPNVGGYVISPMATEIEKQTIQWLAQFIGYRKGCSGLIVSGGNMANMIPFWAARKAKATWDVRNQGMKRRMTAYVSEGTHTWIDKAIDLAGMGHENLRKIAVDSNEKINLDNLVRKIERDLKLGNQPFFITANAGSVSTGVVDPIRELRNICDHYNLWLHADGAYGGIAACLPEADPDLKAISMADSVAIDPHKWMYLSVEAGCVLIKDKKYLQDAFSYRPPYYSYVEHKEGEQTSFYEYGPQNSRSFKSLKVWLAFQQAGRQGYIQSIREDIALSKAFFDIISSGFQELIPHSQNLSICTFQFVPEDLMNNKRDHVEYINRINEEIVLNVQEEGKAFISNAWIGGNYLLRICIVNHRTTLGDLKELPEIILECGHKLHLKNQY